MIMITSMMHFGKGVRAVNDIGMKDALDLFISRGSASWSPATRTYYLRNVNYFMLYLAGRFGRDPGSIMLSDLPQDILIDYAVSLRAKDKFSGHPLRGSMGVSGSIKSNTVNTYMRATKAFMNFLYQSGYTSVRFSEGLRLPKPDNDQVVPLLADEVRRIDAVFDKEVPNDLRNLCIIHLMLDAGLRSSEVCSLKSGDIIFDSDTVVINRSKGDKSRVVILAPPLKGLMQQYFDMSGVTGPLFRKQTDNKPINHAVMCSLFQRVIRNTGISRVHPHLLRHTFATSYILGGGDLETLRILMGHSDYSVTRVYLHLATQYRILGADIYRLDPVFFKSGY